MSYAVWSPDAVTDQPTDAATGQLALGEQSLYVEGDLAAARAAFGRSFERAERDDNALVMARAALGEGGIWVHERRCAADAAQLEERQRRALSRLDPASTLTLRLRTRLAAEADYRAGSCHDVVGLLDEARSRGDSLALAEALSVAHHCMLGPEHTERRARLADELLAVAARTRRPADTVMGLLWRTVDMFLNGDRQAERAYAELLDHQAVKRHAAAAFTVQAMRVMLTIRGGHLREAEVLTEACARAGAAAGDTDWKGWYAAQLLTIRWFQGRVGELLDTVTAMVNSPTLSVVDNSFVAVQAVAAAAAGQTRLARGALARIVGRDLGDLLTSSSWLATMTVVVEAAALLDDHGVAERAYQLLLPYGHLPVMASLAVSCLGSAQHPLGVACLVTGDADRAVEHFRAAVDHNLALGHWPAATVSRHWLAQALHARGGPGEAQRAARFHAEAAAEAADLGMRLPAPIARGGRVSSVPQCTRRGKLWQIELAGRAALVQDMVGLHHLATLAANPGVEIPAVDLAEPDRGPAASNVAPQRLLDDQALRTYRTRLRTLADEIEEAEQCGDGALVAALHSETDWLIHEIQASTGLGGRPRNFADGSERARIAVGKAIRRALAHITAADAVIGAQLQACVQTGAQCSYRPADNG